VRRRVFIEASRVQFARSSWLERRPDGTIEDMNPIDFEKQARALLRQEPFRPFALRLKSGELLVVERQFRLAFDSGSAVSENADGEPVFFAYEDVAEFLPNLPEVAA
jgi:hypothetical protein